MEPDQKMKATINRLVEYATRQIVSITGSLIFKMIVTCASGAKHTSVTFNHKTTIDYLIKRFVKAVEEGVSIGQAEHVFNTFVNGLTDGLRMLSNFSVQPQINFEVNGFEANKICINSNHIESVHFVEVFV